MQLENRGLALFGWCIFLIVTVGTGCSSQYQKQTEETNSTINLVNNHSISTSTTNSTDILTLVPTLIPTSTPTLIPSTTGKIAFLSVAKNQETDITGLLEFPQLNAINFECTKSLNECKTNIIHLANDVDDLHAPSWSPDGKQIVVAHYRHLQPPGQIYLVGLDGDEPIELLRKPDFIHQPIYSPANDMVAYFDTEVGVRVAQVSSGQSATLQNNDAFISALSWSLDGRYLAFEYQIVRGGWHKMYVLSVNEDIFRQTEKDLMDDNVVLSTNWGKSPTLSPDGNYVAYICAENNLETNICLVNLQTKDQNFLVTDGAYEQLMWSPDGERIALVTSRDGNREIYVLTINDGKEIRLTNNDADDLLPNWSPDGAYLTFISNRDDDNSECRIESSLGLTAHYYLDFDCNYEIYIMTVDGTGQKRLTNNNTTDMYPVWGPR